MNKETLPNGGPAFPTENGRQIGNNAYLHEDMALRDYFAAKALLSPYIFDDSTPHKIAQWAYIIADAMLAVREKSTKV